MLSQCLFVLLLSVGPSAAALFINPSASELSFNSSFIVFDVSAHKNSAGDLKSAFNHLRNPEYAVKIIGEERAIFVVRDDDDCATNQADFNGMKVTAFPATSSEDSIAFNNTGLIVMMIDTSLDRNALDQAFNDALTNCENCFKLFAVQGHKPKKFILIGNIPQEQLSDIANSTTTDKCCDKTTVRRAMDFNSFEKQHSLGCIGSQPAALKAVHKPIALHVHKPNDVHRFPDNAHYGNDEHIPVAPSDHSVLHKDITPPTPNKDRLVAIPQRGNFHPNPHNSQYFPGQRHGIEEPHFKFPNLKGRGYSANNYNPHLNFESPVYGEQRSFL